jgi:hypothetical protein
MAKFCSSVILDAAATVIRDRAAKIAVCTSNAIASVDDVEAQTLAVTTLTTGAGSTSFAIQDGDISGRKITIAAQSSIAVGTTGVAGKICLYTTIGTTALLYITECTTQALASTANKVTIPAWKIEFRDAT